MSQLKKMGGKKEKENPAILCPFKSSPGWMMPPT
jgi:hypothetical protein